MKTPNIESQIPKQFSIGRFIILNLIADESNFDSTIGTTKTSQTRVNLCIKSE